MVNRKKNLQVSHKAAAADLVNLLGNDLLTVVEYGREPSLKLLTGCEPSLFIVTSDSVRRRVAEAAEIYPYGCEGVPFMVTESESHYLAQLYPLELIHIRSEYSLLVGSDRVLHAEITREAVTAQLIRELLSLSLQLRSVLLIGTIRGNHCALNTLRRLIPICKGLLSLRDFSIPVSWGSIVSELESSWNLKQFPLSGMIASLEKNPSASLSGFLLPLLEVIDDLRDQLVQNDGRTA